MILGKRAKKQTVGTLQKMQNVVRFIFTNFPTNFRAQEISSPRGQLQKKIPIALGRIVFYGSQIILN